MQNHALNYSFKPTFGLQLCKTISSTQSKQKVQNKIMFQENLYASPRLGPATSSKFLSRLGLNPNQTRKARLDLLDLQLCSASNHITNKLKSNYEHTQMHA